jgi:hypothetical protein
MNKSPPHKAWSLAGQWLGVHLSVEDDFASNVHREATALGISRESILRAFAEIGAHAVAGSALWTLHPTRRQLWADWAVIHDAPPRGTTQAAEFWKAQMRSAGQSTSGPSARADPATRIRQPVEAAATGHSFQPRRFDAEFERECQRWARIHATQTSVDIVEDEETEIVRRILNAPGGKPRRKDSTP